MKEKRTQLNQVQFNIHGDNIVECTRAFNYIVESLSDAVREIIGPKKLDHLSHVHCTIGKL